jgi:hypothetical protein
VASAALRQRLPSGREVEPPLGRPTLVRSFTDDVGRSCRVYMQTVTIDRKPVSATASVCRRPNGQWTLTNARPPVEPGNIAPEDFQCPAAGTLVETSIGGWFRFTQQDGLRCWYQTKSGAADARYAMLLGRDSSWIRQGADRLARLWPLRVGKQVWFVTEGVSAAGYPTSWYETYTVTGRERVTVPAGTFDAYVIAWEEQGREGNGFHAKYTFWFAPEVGYFVKFRGDGSPGSSLADWQATRVDLPHERTSVAAQQGRQPSRASAPPSDRNGFDLSGTSRQ